MGKGGRLEEKVFRWYFGQNECYDKPIKKKPAISSRFIVPETFPGHHAPGTILKLLLLFGFNCMEKESNSS